MAVALQGMPAWMRAVKRMTQAELPAGARVAVELSAEAARALVETLRAVLALAEERGVVE